MIDIRFHNEPKQPKRGVYAWSRARWIKLIRVVRWKLGGKDFWSVGVLENVTERQARRKLDLVKKFAGIACTIALCHFLHSFDVVFANKEEREHYKQITLSQESTL